MAPYSGSSQAGATAPEVAEARENVIAALARMERGERHSLDAMRDVLCSFVSALKSDGATREQAVEAVRQVVSVPASQEGEFRLLPPAREALIELTLHWCAEEFRQAGERVDR
jgi:hypothetical protein